MGSKNSLLLALTAMVLTVLMLWVTSNSVAPKEATWEDALIEAHSGGYRLIATSELARQYEAGAEKMLLVDTRQEWEYRTGHIRGATHFPMEPTAWSRWRKAGALEALLGPDKDRLIVFY
jgi:3-mercaptopyruvate sulfurtransferase SseA